MLAHVSAAQATSFKVLHAFSGGLNGCYPAAGLILGPGGNLYGTTAGGTCSYGTVFKIAPDGTETVLYDFTGGINGWGPDDPLVMDKKGNLYGATIGGGSIGCGVVFKVTQLEKEKTVHDFVGPPNDGCIAIGNMIIDANGNLYGTTSGGGKGRAGAVFELSPDGAETVLHSFCPKGSPPCAHGANPNAGLIADAAGNLDSTTESGGSQRCSAGCGTVFQLAADENETVLYKFKGPPSDGSNSDGALVMDASGSLYGTLFYGGISGCLGDAGCGAVFKLVPVGTETILHFFTGKKGDGANPFAGLVADADGNLYGTTEYGGGPGCTVSALGCGTVFKLATDGTETVLHSFGKGNNGARPIGGVITDSDGNLYGTTNQGGADGDGTVFEVTP